jgi:hypothetical protein
LFGSRSGSNFMLILAPNSIRFHLLSIEFARALKKMTKALPTS